MSLPGLAVRRRTAFTMLFLLMAGAGVFAFLQMGLDYFPPVDTGTVVIVTILPGAGPEEIETLVTDIIEGAVSGVESVGTVESESSASVSGISVNLSLGADIDTAEEDIRKAVDSVRDDLPGNAREPIIMALESSYKPLVIVGFESAALPSHELRRVVEEEIVPVLGRVEGISGTTVSGGEERIVRVEADPVLLWRRGIPISAVYGALSAIQSDQPGGLLESSELETSLGVKTGFRSLNQINELVVGEFGGSPVRIRDVALVFSGHRDQVNRVRLDGSNTVIVVFRKSADANTVETCRALTDELSRIEGIYSHELTPTVVYTQENFITDSVESLAWTGVQAILLAAAVLVIFLGSFANAGIVSISMPVSFIATFAAMRLAGVNLNILSLAGLSISIGMIVDNSVVVLENVHRLAASGADRLTSAERGASEVGLAVTASALTTVAVFIPMLFVKGMTGQIFRDLSITIAAAILISLFVSQTLIPMLASLPKSVVRHHRRGSVLAWFGNRVESLERRYVHLLSWCLCRKALLLWLLVVLVLGTGALLPLIPTAFLPELEEGVVEINASLPQGTSLAFTDSIAAALEDSLLAVVSPGDLRHSWLQTGRSEGVGAIFGSDASCRISISLYFQEESQMTGSITEYESSFRRVLDGVPGLTYTVETDLPIGNSFPIQIALYGSDPGELRDAGDRLKRALGGIEGTVDHRSSLDEWVPQIDFVPDPAVTSLRGVSPASVAAEVTMGLLGVDVSVLTDNGRQVPVNLQYREEFRSSPEAVAALPVLGAPLDSWGRLERVQVPRGINRRDRSRCVLVSCGIRGRPLGGMEAEINGVMDTLDLGGMRWELLGDIPDQREAFGAMQLAIIVAVLLVYMVMAAQFESLLEPFILILEIPMAMVGVVMVHLLTGTTMGLTSLVGILMLAGIVVNNGIVLVDFANRQRATRGLTAEEAVISAGRTRMRPILMTAATTILALLPLSLGGSPSAEVWAPMARTVAGGMLLATPLTLLIVPLLYTQIDRVRRTGRGKA
jgi:HAE1 family hydrophobic/amphiphilic exporter-1